MLKAIPPILFALAMTGLIAIAMLLVGANALFNPNTVPVVSAAPAAASGAGQTADFVQQPASVSDAQLAQAQQSIQQYQEREKQYQQRLDEAVKRLNDANQQISQANQQISDANQTIASYQQLLQELQRRGIIRIDNNGQIFLGRGGDD